MTAPDEAARIRGAMAYQRCPDCDIHTGGESAHMCAGYSGTMPRDTETDFRERLAAAERERDVLRERLAAVRRAVEGQAGPWSDAQVSHYLTGDTPGPLPAALSGAAHGASSPPQRQTSPADTGEAPHRARAVSHGRWVPGRDQ